MHEVSEVEINAIVQPTVFFSPTYKLEILELTNAETDLPKNLQHNGATFSVETQPSSPHLSLKETMVALAEPPPFPRVEAGYSALQAARETSQISAS